MHWRANQIEQARRLIATGISEDLKEVLEQHYPELKESEDERIRRAIVEMIKQCPDTFLNPKNRDSMIAYLEKQKEQKSAEWSEERPEVSARHGWVARDMNNNLRFFSVKPFRDRDGVNWWDRDYLSMEVDGSLFGGLTWEDDPIEVELFIRELGKNARKDE